MHVDSLWVTMIIVGLIGALITAGVALVHWFEWRVVARECMDKLKEARRGYDSVLADRERYLALTKEYESEEHALEFRLKEAEVQMAEIEVREREWVESMNLAGTVSSEEDVLGFWYEEAQEAEDEEDLGATAFAKFFQKATKAQKACAIAGATAFAKFFQKVTKGENTDGV